MRQCITCNRIISVNFMHRKISIFTDFMVFDRYLWSLLTVRPTAGETGDQVALSDQKYQRDGNYR